jgi:hypothetical protein
MPQNLNVLDAATRFLRTNPELLDLALRGAGENGIAVEALLADTVRRARRSGFEAVSQEDVILGTAERNKARLAERIRRSGPAADDARPRLVVLTSGDLRGHGEEQLLNGVAG